MSFLLDQKNSCRHRPSSIGKNIKVDLAVVSDVTELLKSLIKRFKEKNKNFLNSNKQNF